MPADITASSSTLTAQSDTLQSYVNGDELAGGGAGGSVAMASSYNQAVGIGEHAIPASLQQHVTFLTDFNDRSGNAYHLTLNGGSSFGAMSITGPNDWLTNAIADGTSDYLSQGSLPGVLNGQSAATLFVRVRRSSTAKFIQVGSVTSSNANHRFGILFSNPTAIFVAEGGSGQGSGSVANSDTTWQSAALVYDGSGGDNASRLKGYINGAAQSLSYSATILASLTSSMVPWYVGAHFTNNIDADYSEIILYTEPFSAATVLELEDGPELNYVSGVSFDEDGNFDVGTWSLPSPFASGSNGSASYEVVAVNAAGSAVDSTTGSTGTLDLSSEAGNLVYLMVRATNTGGYDIGDYSTRSTSYGSADDGYYELTSVTAASGSAPSQVPHTSVVQPIIRSPVSGLIS